MCVGGGGGGVWVCVCGVQAVIYFNICFHSDVRRTELSSLLLLYPPDTIDFASLRRRHSV